MRTLRLKAAESEPRERAWDGFTDELSQCTEVTDALQTSRRSDQEERVAG